MSDPDNHIHIGECVCGLDMCDVTAEKLRRLEWLERLFDELPHQGDASEGECLTLARPGPDSCDCFKSKLDIPHAE